MNINIDTKNKTISINSDTTVKELMVFLSDVIPMGELEFWTIKTNVINLSPATGNFQPNWQPFNERIYSGTVQTNNTLNNQGSTLLNILSPAALPSHTHGQVSSHTHRSFQDI